MIVNGKALGTIHLQKDSHTPKCLPCVEMLTISKLHKHGSLFYHVQIRDLVPSSRNSNNVMSYIKLLSLMDDETLCSYEDVVCPTLQGKYRKSRIL